MRLRLRSRPTCSTNTPLRHDDRQDRSSPPRTLIPGWSVLCFGWPGRAGCNRARLPMLFDTEGRPPPGGYAAGGGPAFIAFPERHSWRRGAVRHGKGAVSDRRGVPLDCSPSEWLCQPTVCRSASWLLLLNSAAAGARPPTPAPTSERQSGCLLAARLHARPARRPLRADRVARLHEWSDAPGRAIVARRAAARSRARDVGTGVPFLGDRACRRLLADPRQRFRERVRGRH